MKRLYPIPQATAESQARASDPLTSAWVSANAGSGKTHVLAERVIRLLLAGTDPSRILCLTYTRAAAANMSNRVFATLSRWTTLSDGELADAIGRLEGRSPRRERLIRARRLFAEALETPGGLKIQTIHAFCEAVLHQFPLEANIAAQFQMLDQQMERALLAEARRDLITGAAGDADTLTEAFAAVLERGGESGLDDLLAEIMRKRDGLRDFIDRIGDGGRSFAPLFEAFGFGESETVAASPWPLPGFEPAVLEALALACRQIGAGRPMDVLVTPAQAAFAETDAQARLAGLRKAFLSAKGEPYKPDWLFGKALSARMPDLGARYLDAANAVITAFDRMALLRMLEATRAALTVADWLIDRYEELKRGRGFLDFNDLITRTVRLLARADAGPWVQYKLDQGIDHILLDEAQDTSPDQWAVVQLLTGDFFSGAGARGNVLRTIFAVGDEKQSIYSFQGAAPDSFHESRQLFSARVRAGQAEFADLKLTWSFRSTGDVLTAVDRVFADPQVRRGISHDPAPLDHKPIRSDAPGYVEIWPSLGITAADEPEDWAKPVNHASAPAVIVADRIAETIRRWLADGEIIEGKGRPLRAGDVVVLVRKRDRFVHALSKSLKEKGVPVGGADRLALPGHIAVKDLTALGRFLLQPQDDLSLAAVLRSPIFDLPEERLLHIASGRARGVSLATALRQAAKGDPALAPIVAMIDRWNGEAAFRPVFEFYAGLLAGDGAEGVRGKMIARLGPEAGDVLDEFLAFALAEERTGLPGLESFLATLESAGPEIKREMDQTRDEVRIMTVHAAKGLEAPVVFLVDSGSRPFSDQHLPRLMPVAAPGGEWLGTGYVWRSGSDVANAVSRGVADRARELADDEYRRLLYVGMTRAEDRLIVAGYHGKKEPVPQTWHSIVMRALSAASETVQVPHPVTGEPVLRFRVTDLPPLPMSGEPAAAVAQEREPLPRMLFAPLPPDEDLPRPLSPSGASALMDDRPEPAADLRSPVLDMDDKAGFAIQRGLALHKLLQMLPAIPPPQRHAATLRYLARIGGAWPLAERERAIAAVEAILDEPRFAPIFAPGSRAEVELLGTVDLRGKPRSVAGKVDRLAVTDNEVLIVDYKTDRSPPASAAAVSPSYVLQLALYRALLRPLYPARPVEAALLFTEAPRLIALPSSALDQALARLGSA